MFEALEEIHFRIACRVCKVVVLVADCFLGALCPFRLCHARPTVCITIRIKRSVRFIGRHNIPCEGDRVNFDTAALLPYVGLCIATVDNPPKDRFASAITVKIKLVI